MENKTTMNNRNSTHTGNYFDHFGGTVELYKILFAIIDGLGICGNLVVILTIYRNGNMRSSIYYLLCNLAMADLLFAMLLPLHVRMLTENYVWQFGESFCKIYFAFYRLLYGVSMMNMLAITVQRFRATQYPIAFRLKSRRTTRLIATCWVLSFIISLPFFFVIKHERDGKNYFCFQKWPNKETQRAYYIIVYTLLYILPFIFMAVMYGSMFHTLRKPPVGDINDAQQRLMKKRKEMSLVAGIIVLAFFICWSPWTILEFLHAMDLKFGGPASLPIVKNYSLLAVVLSTVVNPVLLNFMSSEFREGFRALFRCSSCYHSETVNVNTAAVVGHAEIVARQACAQENGIAFENTSH